jgi:predicted RNase H-like nuclease (RuvC/YqgF family)
MKRYTVKELQDTIKAQEKLVEYYEDWLQVLGEANNRKQKTITRQKARIKVLGAALVASQRDYEQLKRKRK